MQAKPNMMDDIYAFSNCGFFIFPLLVTDPRKMNAFLSSRPEWESNDKSFYPQYLLHYASRMTGIANDRLRCFRYKAPLSLPLYFFDAQIRERLLRRGETYCGGSPDLQAISLYWFGTGIAFLEFSVLYGDMPASEITEFTYLFRSLRFNETRLNGFPEDKIALETAIKQILPEEQSSSVICFNNPALFKKQANIFTLLNSKSCAIEPEKIERCRYLLSHGYNSEFAEKTADEHHMKCVSALARIRSGEAVRKAWSVSWKRRTHINSPDYAMTITFCIFFCSTSDLPQSLRSRRSAGRISICGVRGICTAVSFLSKHAFPSA